MKATSTLAPRVVVVTRATDLGLLIAEHGTREQARFITKDRTGWFDEAVRRDELQRLAVDDVLRAIPSHWRRGRITRDDLPTFGFAPEDIIVPVGPDGLVANVAKYLERQPVIGVNPDPLNVTGLLARFSRADIGQIFARGGDNELAYEERTLIEAQLDDGQRLRAVNEIFIGHRSHQSARYRLRIRDRQERQSSSGVIVATGTGATGWMRSISHDRGLSFAMDAASSRLAVLVREAFPAPGFGTELTADVLDGEGVCIISEMGDGGVIFGDGMETDFLHFPWGRRVDVRVSPLPLRLICAPHRTNRVEAPESVRRGALIAQ